MLPSHLALAIFLLVCLSCSASQNGKKLLHSLNHYEVVHFATSHFHTMEKNADLGNYEQPDRTEFAFSALGHDIRVRGQKNTDLLAPDYHEVRQTWRDGQMVEKRVHRVIDKASNCWYQGHVAQRQGFSRAAFSTCSGAFRGTVVMFDNHFVIEPAVKHLDADTLLEHLQRIQSMDVHQNLPAHQQPSLQSLHMVYRSEDVDHPHFFCPVDDSVDTPVGEQADPDHDHDHDHDHAHGVEGFLHTLNSFLPEYASMEVSAQEEGTGETSRRAETQGTGQQYLELIVVNDYRRFLDHREAPEDDTVDIVNLMNGYYTAQVFNPPITITLINQITFDSEDPWEADINLGCDGDCGSAEAPVGTLLNEFNSFRADTNNIDPHDDAQLFSDHDFEGGVLGYASVSAVCTYSRQSGIDMAPSSQSIEFTTAVVAHEIGHNFGSSHDSSSNTCPTTGFIMNAEVSASGVPTTFSECTETYIDYYMGLSSVTCAMNVPTQRWGDPVCGNNWVETGEDCDCGSSDCSATDPCCDGQTCMYAENAVCSEDDVCCQDCQPVAAGVECRTMTGDPGCDLSEFCDGISGACPVDGTIGPGADCTYVVDVHGVETEMPGLCYLGTCYSDYRQCFETGESFDGAPYNQCPWYYSVALNGWVDGVDAESEKKEHFCGTLWCQNDPTSCTYFRVSGQVAVVDNGVPCSDGEGSYQCLNSECVNSGELNLEYQWVATEWDNCVSCDDDQEREVVCESIEEPGLVVINELCSSASLLPSTQLCANETIACDHNQGLATNELDIFGVIVSKNTLVFASLGFVSVNAILLLICNDMITAEEKEETTEDEFGGLDGM